MAEGGAGNLSFAELSARLYPMAANVAARVSRDQTVFVGQVHRDHVDAFYELFRDVLVRPLRPETVHFAIRLAVRELRRLAAEGLTEAQFEHVRSFADRYFSLNLQTASRRLGFAMDDDFHGVDQAYLERLRGACRALTVEQLNAAIARHIHPERLSSAIVAAEPERLRAAIASEAESPITYEAGVPEPVTAEDREIVGYQLGIPRDRIRIVPLARMFAE